MQSRVLILLGRSLINIARHSKLTSALLLSLKVKGQANEDAVLCTDDKTFTMRSVILSNSMLVVTSPLDASSAQNSNDGVVIRDQVNEIMELTPCVPKLYKLATLLRGREYDEGEDDNVSENHEVCPVIYTIVEALGRLSCRKGSVMKMLEQKFKLVIANWIVR
jgi:sister chromatid cohesion protein DCC1